MAHFLLPISVSTLLFFLHILSPPPTAADTSVVVVRDFHGNPLKAGSDYYIMSTGNGGGIKLHHRDDTPSCPLYVGLTRKGLDRGQPIRLIPINSTGEHVRVSEDLNIVVKQPTICPNQVWMVKYNRSRFLTEVVTGGVVGVDDDTADNSSRFKIEKAVFGDHLYNIAHLDSYLGSYWDYVEGNFYLRSQSRLAPTLDPLGVTFVEASDMDRSSLKPGHDYV